MRVPIVSLVHSIETHTASGIHDRHLMGRSAPLRRIERAGRRLLNGGLAPFTSPGPPLARVPKGTALRGILLMRWDAVGDMATCLPLFRELRTLHPEAEIGIVASKRNTPLLRYEAGFRVILWDRNPKIFLKSLAAAREFQPDAVVDTRMHYDSTTSFLYGLVSGAEWTLSTSNRDERLPFSVRVPVPLGGRHFIELTAMLLSGLGRDVRVTGLDRKLRLSVLERAFAARFWREAGLSLRGRAVALNVSAGNPRRAWGVESWVDLCRFLTSARITPLIFSTPADRGTALSIAEAGGALTAPEFPDILHAAALLEEMRLLVTPDTAMVHIAAAHGVPVVGLYPVREAHMPLWYPWEVAHRLVRTPDPERVSAVPPAMVIDAVTDLLASTGGIDAP
jgi:ADP-heptose:LPS heptosyltransferase